MNPIRSTIRHQLFRLRWESQAELGKMSIINVLKEKFTVTGEWNLFIPLTKERVH